MSKTAEKGFASTSKRSLALMALSSELHKSFILPPRPGFMDLEFESRDSGVRSNYAPGGHSAASEDVLILRTGRMLLDIPRDTGRAPPLCS